MKLADITPLILTFNEEDNIARTLAALRWAREIVVVDSGSTDRTEAVLREHPQVRVLKQPFDSHARQWNFALREGGVRTPWVLALDADHVLTPALVAELQALEPSADLAGYRVGYTYVIHGHELRGSLYPPAVALFRLERARYLQDGHTQRVEIQGAIGELSGRILHDDRKPAARWYEAQRRYLAHEAEKLWTSRWRELSWPDRARRLFLGPLLVLPYCLLLKGLIADGRAGLTYSYQRLYAESMLAKLLLERMLRNSAR